MPSGSYWGDCNYTGQVGVFFGGGGAVSEAGAHVTMGRTVVRVAQGQGSCCPQSDGQRSPVMFLREPRSSSSQAASEPGSAAQEWPRVPSAARSATQARSWPSASTSCQHDEALKAATSSVSLQAGNGRQDTGSPGPPTRHSTGGGTGSGSQNRGLISEEMGKKYLCGI